MDDLISRQAALDAMGERPLTWTGGDYELGCRNQYDTDRLAIETVPSAQPGWIPCSTALPEYDGEYLVTKKSFGWNCNEYTETDIARYEKKNGWHKADTVLAWCELPKPWEGGQDNGAD